MKKILFAVLIFGILFTMNNCNNEEEQEDPSTYTLIGTWETEGVTYNIPFKCTLIFLNETDFEQDSISTRQDGIVTHKNKGTYIREEDRIIFTDVEHASNKYTHPYKFIDKNTLDTFGIGFMGWDIEKMIFKRKS
jgi:hypothetical protein